MEILRSLLDRGTGRICRRSERQLIHALALGQQTSYQLECCWVQVFEGWVELDRSPAFLAVHGGRWTRAKNGYREKVLCGSEVMVREVSVGW